MPRVTDKTADDTGNAYYATLQAGESTGTVPAGIPRGIPAILHKKSGKAKQFKDSAENEVRYVIERTCNAAGAATVTNCDMLPPKQGLGTTIHDPTAPELPRYPFYRVTIRVDGPQNTVSFVQAMLR